MPRQDKKTLDPTLPLLRGLLAELIGLEDRDAALPVHVLVRLKPAVLHEGMSRLMGEAVRFTEEPLGESQARQVSDLLGQRYPNLARGTIYEGSFALAGEMHAMIDTDYLELRDGRTRPRILRDLVAEAFTRWMVYEPLVMLYLLGEHPEGTDRLGRILEVELGLHPEVRQMILDLSDTGD